MAPVIPSPRRWADPQGDFTTYRNPGLHAGNVALHGSQEDPVSSLRT